MAACIIEGWGIADLRWVESKPPHLRLKGKLKIHTGPKPVVHSRLIQADAEKGSWHHQKNTPNRGVVSRSFAMSGRQDDLKAPANTFRANTTSLSSLSRSALQPGG
jgi:hypothetical protein